MFPRISTGLRACTSCLALAMPLFANAPAMADCVAPSGNYVGSGAGPTVFKMPPAKYYASGMTNQTVSLSISPSGTQGRIWTAAKFTNPAQAISHPFTFSTGSVTIYSQDYWAKNPVTQPMEGFDLKRCMGVLRTDEVVTASVDAVPIDTDPTTPIASGRMSRWWLMAVSDNGKVITLTDFEKIWYDSATRVPKVLSAGYPIRLERQ